MAREAGVGEGPDGVGGRVVGREAVGEDGRWAFSSPRLCASLLIALGHSLVLLAHWAKRPPWEHRGTRCEAAAARQPPPWRTVQATALQLWFGTAGHAVGWAGAKAPGRKPLPVWAPRSTVSAPFTASRAQHGHPNDASYSKPPYRRPFSPSAHRTMSTGGASSAGAGVQANPASHNRSGRGCDPFAHPDLLLRGRTFEGCRPAIVPPGQTIAALPPSPTSSRPEVPPAPPTIPIPFAAHGRQKQSRAGAGVSWAAAAQGGYGGQARVPDTRRASLSG